MDNFVTIKSNSEFEVVEKKSKFIGHVFYVENIEEAENIIKQVKKKYFDARHNCYAYRIINDKEIIQKSSDDGEPSGTAGAPILNILEKNNIVNCLIIITRYFGGILLGTGGLVKAYSETALGLLNKAELKNIIYGCLMKIVLEYQYLDAFKYFCRKEGIIIQKEEYMENIILYIKISHEMEKMILENKVENSFKISKAEKIEDIYI